MSLVTFLHRVPKNRQKTTSAWNTTLHQELFLATMKKKTMMWAEPLICGSKHDITNNDINKDDITNDDVMLDRQWTDIKINKILMGHGQTDNVGHTDTNGHTDGDK